MQVQFKPALLVLVGQQYFLNSFFFQYKRRFVMRNKFTDNNGFTLIEIIIVIVILGILTIVSVPRFLNVSDESHTSVSQGVYGSFNSAVNITRSKWLAGGASGTTVVVGPTTLNVTGNGLPGSPFDTPSCMTLWNTIQEPSPAVNPWLTVPLIQTADGWEALGLSTICLYLYKPDTSPFRGVIYYATIPGPGGQVGEIVSFP